MTVEIHRADSEHNYTRVAVFEGGQWVEGGDAVDAQGFYEGADDDVLLDDFAGPELVAIDPVEAVDPDVVKSQRTLNEYGGGRP
jgi:hypothetical protein